MENLANSELISECISRMWQGSFTDQIRCPNLPPNPTVHFAPLEPFPNRWWKLDPSADTASLSSSLSRYWIETVWPWLESNKRLPEAARTLERTNPPAAAAAHLVLGQPDEAVRLVRLWIANLEAAIQAQSGYPANAELTIEQLQNFRGWAARHHLL